MTVDKSTLVVISRPNEFRPMASSHCGRPNNSKRPCRMPRVLVCGAPMYEAVLGKTLRQWEMGGCKGHLTDAERTFIEIAERLAITEDAVLDYKRRDDLHNMSRTVGQTTNLPACWGWFDIDQLARERGFPVPTPTDMPSLEAWHQGKCAICGRLSALVYDHDHWSGLVRGMLCRACNNPRCAGIYSLYCLRHPAGVFGLRIPYTPGMRAAAKVAHLMSPGYGDGQDGGQE